VSTTPVYICGVGMHRFGRFPEMSLKQLAAHAALEALADAGIGIGDVQAVFAANAYAGLLTGQESIRGETWMRPLGVGGAPVFNVENACASGSTAVHLATLAVRSGAYDTVLVVGAEKMYVQDTHRTLKALESSTDLETLGGMGIQFMAIDALRVREFADEEGLTERDLAWTAVKAHENGAHNPMAQYQRPVSYEEVLGSRMIAEPIRLLMCSAISDGAAAVVISSRPRNPARAVRIVASQAMSSPFRDVAATGLVRATARRAYEEAGVGPEDLEIVELHDAVSPAELIYYRELGLCPPGEVAALARSGKTERHGALPVNPSGGLNSRGHPVGATGVAQLCELVWQMRGEAGARQVRHVPRVGLAHNNGGWMGEDPAVCICHILQR